MVPGRGEVPGWETEMAVFAVDSAAVEVVRSLPDCAGGTRPAEGYTDCT